MESNKQMIIAFFGDSFSYDNTGYTREISKYFNCVHENYSQPASSPLHAYQQLLNRFSKDEQVPDVAVITITHSDRLFHDKYLIRGNGAVNNDFTPVTENVNTAVSTYYSELFSIEGSKLMHRLFCQGLAQFSLEHESTKFIFLPCFDSFTGSKIGNYVVTGPRLMNFAEMDMDMHIREFNGEHVRDNHMSEKFNKNLANIIIREIERYKYNRPKFVDILGDMLL
jgi:hypothetical protein